MSILAKQFLDLRSVSDTYSTSYQTAQPFKHIVLDDFFDEDFLGVCLDEFPDLRLHTQKVEFSDSMQIKFATDRGDHLLGPNTMRLLQYLNSHQFLDFLNELTGIEEPLIADPHYIGGGLHQIFRGGKLGVHADFNIHRETQLDRRINILIYLNRDWPEEYGGHLELWDRQMQACQRRVLPIFNRVVIFNTDDFSFHGHPDPVSCPEDRSRRSFALYYYSNGRPPSEVSGDHSTIFRERFDGEYAEKAQNLMTQLKRVVRAVTPPIIYSMLSSAVHKIRSIRTEDH